jgi:hypothetical protein
VCFRDKGGVEEERLSSNKLATLLACSSNTPCMIFLEYSMATLKLAIQHLHDFYIYKNNTT